MFKNRKKEGHLITPIVDARINEITRGYASIISRENLLQNHPQEIETLNLNGWFHNIPIAGQSCIQLDQIIHSFLAYLRESCADRKVIVVGHGTWINLCCRILTNRSIEETEKKHHEEFYVNCGVTVFEKDNDGDFVLVDESLKVWG